MSSGLLHSVRGTFLAARCHPDPLATLARCFSTTAMSTFSTLSQHPPPPENLSQHTSPAEPVDPSAPASPPTSQQRQQAGERQLGDASAPSSSGVQRLVVFGGSGYVGTRVCEAAVNLGADVVSISRHGRPSYLKSPWADAVKWLKGDAFDERQPWKEEMQGAAGVFSTLGAFGSNELMYRVCGQANMTLMDAAAQAHVPRFGFISVHDFRFPGGWQAQRFLLRGYFQGKRDAEAHLFKLFPEGGVALRPSFVYGTRTLPSGSSLPLGVIGAPLAAAMKVLPSKSLSQVPIVGAAFVPPVPVESVGRAAAAAVLQPERVPPGIMDVWTIAKF